MRIHIHIHMYIFGITVITGISKQKEVLNGKFNYKLMNFYAIFLFCFHFLQLGVCKN